MNANDENFKLVKGIVHDRLFCPGQALPNECIAIEHYPDALCLACDEPPHVGVTQDKFENIQHWSALIEDEKCSFLRAVRRDARKHHEKAAGEVAGLAQRQAIQLGLLDLSDTIDYEVRLIYYHLQFPKLDMALAARMWTAVKAGGVPCGWSGKYPSGSMLVFWPTEKGLASVEAENSGKPLYRPDEKLEMIVGKGSFRREIITTRLYDYIDAHGLEREGSIIAADDLLRPIIGGSDSISMFALAAHVDEHLQKVL